MSNFVFHKLYDPPKSYSLTVLLLYGKTANNYSHHYDSNMTVYRSVDCFMFLCLSRQL